MEMLRILGCLIWLFTCTTLSADVVRFNNGDRLTGEIVAINNGVVQIDVAHLGRLSAPMHAIAEIDRVSGLASPPREAVTALAIAPLAQMAATAWETNADLGYVLSSGNTNTEDLSIVVASKLSRGVFEHRFGVNVSQAEADDVTTKDMLDVDYEIRWSFREAWYALGNLEYFKDDLKGIDQRVTVGAGVGRTFWENDVGALTSDIGISQVFEELGGEDENNPAVRWGLNYNRWLEPERLELFYSHRFLKILDSARGEVWNSDTGLRFHVNERWNANVRVDVQHDTKPLPGFDRTDVTYTVGVGIKI